jgi:uncharacterized membrane protein
MKSIFVYWQTWALLSAVFAALLLGETLSVKNWAGVALIAGGAVLVRLKR